LNQKKQLTLPGINQQFLRERLVESREVIKRGSGRGYYRGTCLDIHKLQAPETFTVATLKELYDITAECDKVISF